MNEENNNVPEENKPDQNTERQEYDVYQTVTPNYTSAQNQNQTVYQGPVITKKKNRNGALLAIAVVCAVLCLASLVFAVSMALGGSNDSFKFPSPVTPQYQYMNNTQSNGEKMDAASVIEKVNPSVVVITTQIVSQYGSGTGLGSGFIISSNGIIATNAHVVEGARAVKVKLYDGKEYDAEILGTDTTSDLAVLKIDANDLQAVEIGDSDQVVAGEEVIAIGHPYSPELSYSATKGIVSSIRDNYHLESLGLVLNLFQHDAAINSGNSGGPLVNMYGQVIGINSVKIAGDYENMGFAIQMSTAMPIIEQLINNGQVERPKLGVTCSTETSIGGALVASVTKGGPADLAGIQAGDLITKLNGERVKTTEELIQNLEKLEIGATVELTVLRDAETITVNATLVSQDEISKLEPQTNSNNNSSNNNNNSESDSDDNGFNFYR